MVRIAERAERYEQRSQPFFRFRLLTDEIVQQCDDKSSKSSKSESDGKIFCYSLLPYCVHYFCRTKLNKNDSHILDQLPNLNDDWTITSAQPQKYARHRSPIPEDAIIIEISDSEIESDGHQPKR